MSNKKGKIRNMVYGAFIGDAIGAFVEFKSESRIDDEDLKQAMAMIGGGTHGTARGQITDDSEMALALLRSISNCSLPRKYSQERALAYYRAWADSRPFDMGNTTSRALKRCTDYGTWDHCVRVGTENYSSQANGALMRLSPLIAYVSKNDIRRGEAYDLAYADTELTHPSRVCLVASAFYMELGLQLIDAVDYTKDNIQRIITSSLDAVRKVIDRKTDRRVLGVATDEVSEVITDQLNSAHDLPRCDDWNSGWYGIALKCTIWALLNAESYRDGIRSIIAKGGDTDTNACIAGAMLGIIFPPEEWRATVVDYCNTDEGRSRPAIWTTKGGEGAESLRSLLKNI